jgi:hypothetical protein
VLTDKNGGKGTGTKTKLRDGDEGIVPLLDALYLLAVELIILWNDRVHYRALHFKPFRDIDYKSWRAPGFTDASCSSLESIAGGRR